MAVCFRVFFLAPLKSMVLGAGRSGGFFSSRLALYNTICQTGRDGEPLSRPSSESPPPPFQGQHCNGAPGPNGGRGAERGQAVLVKKLLSAPVTRRFCDGPLLHMTRATSQKVRTPMTSATGKELNPKGAHSPRRWRRFRANNASDGGPRFFSPGT